MVLLALWVAGLLTYQMPDELLAIADRMLSSQNYRFGDRARETFARYLALRLAQPHFANARSVRNALDRARLRQASRLFAQRNKTYSENDLSTLEVEDIKGSRLFRSNEH